MGNVKYIGWKLEFYYQQNLVEDLQETARKMEEELEIWKEEVRKARNEFQELNNYTTCQLLVLRSELGKVKACVSAPYQKAQVMALLQSISLDVTPSDVERVVAMERRTITDGEKLDEGTILATAESSTTDSCQQSPVPCSTTNLSENTFFSIDAQTPHSEDTSVKGAVVKHSIRDLDEERLDSFRNITKKYNYPEQFVLKAIKGCGTGDWYDIMNWIRINKEELNKTLQSMASDDSEEDSEEEEEEEEEESSILEKSQEDEVMIKGSSPGTCT